MSCREIKGLVTEAFYGQNTLIVSHCAPSPLSDPNDDVIWYPPPAISGYVRHSHLHLHEPSIRTFRFLFKIADGTLGFAHFHSIYLTMFGGPSRCLNRKHRIAARVAFPNYLGSVGKVEFWARTLTVEYRHDSDGLVDDMELPVLEKFNLWADEGKVHQRLVRYYWSEEESEVKAWPDEDPWRIGRVTKMVLSI